MLRVIRWFRNRWRAAMATVKQTIRLWLDIVENPAVELGVVKGQQGVVRAEFEVLRAECLADRSKVQNALCNEVTAQVTGAVHGILAREVSWRFERELQARIVAAIDAYGQVAFQRYSLVPLPDIQESVERCVQAVISARLVALIGEGSITIGLPRPSLRAQKK